MTRPAPLPADLLYCRSRGCGETTLLDIYPLANGGAHIECRVCGRLSMIAPAVICGSCDVSGGHRPDCPKAPR